MAKASFDEIRTPPYTNAPLIDIAELCNIRIWIIASKEKWCKVYYCLFCSYSSFSCIREAKSCSFLMTIIPSTLSIAPNSRNFLKRRLTVTGCIPRNFAISTKERFWGLRNMFPAWPGSLTATDRTGQSGCRLPWSGVYRSVPDSFW